MKLVIAIVHDDDSFKIIEKLNIQGHSVTRLCSTGGFLRAGNTTLMAGVDDLKLDEVINIIIDESHKHKTGIPQENRQAANFRLPSVKEIVTSGSIIFVTNVEKFEKF